MKFLPVLILAVFIVSGCDSLKGPTGSVGPHGEKGEQGPEGETGLDGAQGDKGETGLQGEQGDQGEKGETGIDGAHGNQGDKGNPGDPGIDGAQGEQGVQGNKGDIGSRGVQGLQGNPGKDAKFTIFEGTLVSGDPYWWLIETDIILEKCIISVRVSVGSDFMPPYIEPDWFFKWDTIYIMNDVSADSGDRYYIIIASEPD